MSARRRSAPKGSFATAIDELLPVLALSEDKVTTVRSVRRRTRADTTSNGHSTQRSAHINERLRPN